MADFDVFNGDADGIFSLLQLRQAEPRPEAERVTGVKRDVALLRRIADRVCPNDRVTALDISMAKNTDALRRALERGAEVLYIDHHQTGEVPHSERLSVITDDALETCTAWLVDGHLRGAHADWAVCGAFGDNFTTLAARIARSRNLDLPMGRLRELGELVNYNAYGLSLDDLHFHPDEVFQTLLRYPGPVAFLDDGTELFATLKAGFHSDWDVAQGARTLHADDAGQVLVLPQSPASNRISGLFGNALVDEDPGRAFAILTEIDGGQAFRVSIRAPRARVSGAAVDVATRFSGGGRRAAAGIDALPHDQLDTFVDAFREAFAL